MADHNEEAPSSPGGPARSRPRAPTITINTTAGESISEQNPANELRPSNSFDRDRPTSPHNVSSPTQSNLLAVPGARSRASSVDTDTGSAPSGTFVGSSTNGGDVGNVSSLGKDAHGHEILSDEEALKPDPGTEPDFVRENNPFAYTPGQFGKLLNPKSLGAFHALGGLEGIEKGLFTDCKAGLSTDETKIDGSRSFHDVTGATDPQVPTLTGKETNVKHEPHHDGDKFTDRLRIFSDNRLPERKSKSIWELAWIAYKDKILLLLSGAAVISLALGLYQTFGNDHAAEGSSGEWIEGVAIIVAILIVVFVGALNDWQKERQFVKLNRKKEDRSVKVVRSGRTQEISIYDILVGDVMLLEPGDLIPVDGVFIEGHGIKCDESSATGESDLLKKTPAHDVWRAMENNEPLKKMDPFILSGAKVTEGVGRFLVTSVGVHSSFGKTMMSLREDNDPTPLQVKLNVLAEYIAKLGGAAALTLFVVLLIKFLAELNGNPRTPSEKGQQFLQIFIVAVTIVVVAVPEGLPLAVTLALAFATKKMTKDNNLVRVLRSCETMGNATTVCSDKTGTLTQNVMTVVAGAVGTSSRFANKATVATDNVSPSAHVAEKLEEQLDDVGVQEFLRTLHDTVKTSWRDSIANNSTAFEAEDKGQSVFVGSKTETSLLQFSRDFLGMESVAVERSNADVKQLFPFDSGRKCMGVVLKTATGGYRLYVKGASEIMLRSCTSIIRDPTKGMDATEISEENVDALNHLIETYASRSLRTIGFIYRDFESWPPKGARTLEDDKSQAQFDGVLKDMTFFGLVGIQDPLRPGVPDAVADCIRAGVFPRMVTGDNILTAKAIASECGIFTAGGVAMEGPVFRKLSKQQQREIIPKLQVLARSSPEDKRVLVRRLKEMGETVAVTGDGTNDAPALKAADVGFSMGIAGTEVAKEASDIILMDDNFTSIVKGLMWGRAVNDAVRKFLQFQITVNITAVMLAFISAVSSDDEVSVLTAVQLLWVNLIMDTFAALALATDPPTRQVLFRKPVPKSAGLFTLNMWKMIIGQAIFQLVVTLILYFGGTRILSYDSPREQRQLRTLVFNTFVWMQIFNQVNSRRLDNNFNIFEGMTRNKFFIGINCIMIGGQVLIIFVGGSAFSVVRLNGPQWGYSIVLGFLSWPVGVIIRLIPDELIASLIPESFRRRSKPKVVINDDENPFEYNQGIMDIKEELGFIKKYKGGRLNNLKFTVKHPREALLPSRSRSEISLPGTPVIEPPTTEKAALPSPSPMPPSPDSRRRSRSSRSRSNSALAGAAMAGIVAGSIGGWSPINDEGQGGSLKYSRIRSKSDLSKEVPLEVHPDTREDDPVFVENPIEAAGHAPPSQSVNTTPAFTIGPYAGQPRLSSDRREEKEDV